MLQIFIHGTKEKGFLDIYPGTVLDMESLSDIFDEDLTTGEFSLPVEIPWTENNRRLMGFAERLENFKLQPNFWVCHVYDRGFPELMNAKITLLEKSGAISYTKGKFNASISGTKGLFGSAIKNKNLRDLYLGGPITWEFGTESRAYATDHMKGLHPGLEHFAFAPVAIEKYFDPYPDTYIFLAKDTVNFIVSTGGGADDWEFGRPDPADPDTPTDPGVRDHLDYRTIPFFNFKYVLNEAFREAGYTVTGDFISRTDFDDLFIFNNCSVEHYIMSLYEDYNRKIFPADHVPDMKLVDFFKATFQFFNMYPVFSGNNQVELLYRKKIFTDRKILDLTDRAGPVFSSTYRDDSGNDGYSVDYEWDQKDQMLSDRVKELDKKINVGTVSTFADLETLDIGRSFTTDDIAYVEADNMWYVIANATTTPKLWDAFSEGLDKYTTGNGDRSVSAGMGTLCSYVEFDVANALYEVRNRVGTQQPGSYWDYNERKIINPFSLRVFYIKKQTVDGNLIPVSFSNNRAADNSRIVPYSLALNGDDGIVKNFHEDWQRLQQQNETVKIPFAADKKMMNELGACNTIAVNNILFVPYKTESKLPLQSTVEIEMVPL